jgi:hypothetical protein
MLLKYLAVFSLSDYNRPAIVPKIKAWKKLQMIIVTETKAISAFVKGVSSFFPNAIIE